MNVSKAYAAENIEWIKRGQFKQVYDSAADAFQNELAKGNPRVTAGRLDFLATCYSTRGCVALLKGDQEGWHDIQCGYMSSVYALRFEIKAALPAWAPDGRMDPNKQIKLPLNLGFAKLFKQKSDVQFLESAIAAHFKLEEVIGKTCDSGRILLRSLLGEDDTCSFEELLRDRNACCQKRDAWPCRPMEIRPFGIIDIELILLHPANASFPYSSTMKFTPTADDLIEQAMIYYHTNFND